MTREMLVRIRYSDEQVKRARAGKPMEPTLANNIGACINRMIQCQATGGITIDIAAGRPGATRLILSSGKPHLVESDLSDKTE